MPVSRSSKSVRTRVEYLGEPRFASKAGIARDGSHGIDACTPGQRRLRTLLALGIFNNAHSTDAVFAPAEWGLSHLVAYTMVISPRYDELVLIADTPHNVVSYLLPSRVGDICFPGLRLEEIRTHETFITRHVPTGTRLVVTGERSGRWPLVPNTRRKTYGFLTLDDRVHEREHEQLDRLPAVHEDAERLLAGLVTRLAAQDPGRQWALGNWFYDPLRRPRDWEDASGSRAKRLWGAAESWTLGWSRFPFVQDVALSLADSPIGIDGACIHRDKGRLEVRLGEARLKLNGLPAHRSPVASEAL